MVTSNVPQEILLQYTKLEEKLGFHEIKKILFDHCTSNSGKAKVNEMSFLNQFDSVRSQLDKVGEFSAMLTELSDFNRYVPDIHTILSHLYIKNRCLDGLEIIEIAKAIDYCEQLNSFFKSDPVRFPNFNEGLTDVYFNISLVEDIRSKIHPSGEVKDGASGELRKIRVQQNSLRKELRSVLNRILKRAKELKYTSSDVELTVNNGRLVIPLFAEYKRKIKGLVHDESRTGQTVYFEPQEVIRLNNDLKELIFDENREVHRILSELTLDLRGEVDVLETIQSFNSEIDLFHAKVLLAEKYDGVVPNLTQSEEVFLEKAYHPVLYLKHRATRKKTVPFSVSFDGKNRLLILSGPNAGGKSICLKAIGLIQYMIQCGIPVPVEEKSQFQVKDQILVDIGDDQSIESDLSTYSAHLSTMKGFLESVTADSLLIFDEFGTGTDPDFGGAIAEAFIEEFNRSKCKGVISSHYGNIKLMANHTEGLFNGNMQFDMEGLQPTFELTIGKPGSSFALELAQKIGIGQQVLGRTKQLLGGKKVQFDNMLNEAQRENQKLKEELNDLQQTKRKLEQKYKQFVDLSKNLKDQKRDILNEAKREAQNIIKSANKEVESVIRDIKESQADKEKTKQARERLGKVNKKLKVKEKASEVEKVKVQASELKIGDTVQIKGTETVGTIAEKNGTQLVVEVGALKTRVAATKVDKVRLRKAKKDSGGSNYSNISNLEFKPVLDLRGKKPGDALNELDKFLNSALLSHVSNLTVIHGRGTGVLRREIRDHLNRLDFVKNYESETEEFGGDGVTLVEI